MLRFDPEKSRQRSAYANLNCEFSVTSGDSCLVTCVGTERPIGTINLEQQLAKAAALSG